MFLLKDVDEGEMLKVAHKKRERTRQQASELKEMQKFLLIKVNQTKKHFFFKRKKIFLPIFSGKSGDGCPGLQYSRNSSEEGGEWE